MARIEYRVNDVVQETDHHTLTPNEILEHAGVNPELHYLEETHPDHISFEDKPHESIRMIEHMRFRSEHRVIEYRVNDERQETRHRALAAKEILVHAGIDPATNYLVEVHPEHVSFEDKPDEPIKMHQHMKFISVSVKPTPVSGS